jgi:hypothetical protein
MVRVTQEEVRAERARSQKPLHECKKDLYRRKLNTELSDIRRETEAAVVDRKVGHVESVMLDRLAEVLQTMIAGGLV